MGVGQRASTRLACCVRLKACSAAAFTNEGTSSEAGQGATAFPASLEVEQAVQVQAVDGAPMKIQGMDGAIGSRMDPCLLQRERRRLCGLARDVKALLSENRAHPVAVFGRSPEVAIAADALSRLLIKVIGKGGAFQQKRSNALVGQLGEETDQQLPVAKLPHRTRHGFAPDRRSDWLGPILWPGKKTCDPVPVDTFDQLFERGPSIWLRGPAGSQPRCKQGVGRLLLPHG